jgi:aspartate kinase
MALIVLKFGGTSLADIAKIEAVAIQIKREIESGNRLLVVVSAMAGVTNQLVEFVCGITAYFDPVECDAVLAAGEQITAGLLAIALQKHDIPARSWQAWQAGIMAHGRPMSGEICQVNRSVLLEDIEKGRVPIVTGFQAISLGLRVITLGRGGSDTSAVMLAAHLGAQRCDIYTDVDGIYTADPKWVPNAHKHDIISYEDMLEMASVGAKVLQVRSVVAAMGQGVPLRVLSTFKDQPGTMIVQSKDIVNPKPLSGVVVSKNEVMIQISGSFSVVKVMKEIGDLGITIDMVSIRSKYLEFLIQEAETQRVKYELERKADVMGISSIIFQSNISKVSVIGLGIRSNQDFLSSFFEAVSQATDTVLSFMATENRASILVPTQDGEAVVLALHTHLGF